ncbi:RagB/SusD family nutrient uptake outer membrane protein [Olivibacter sp. CPCC 100613]|uniref:RagB/SusD family nutrient uptake outer membrane protein n=1 Tax=Olivibacter sp. CPCC 100613 TaxID=3079931 RepID=UPI002FF7CA28
MRNLTYLILVCLCCACVGCKKYLEAKPDEALTLLSDNLEAVQLLLDNTTVMNTQYPAANLLASDDVQISDETWQNLYQRSIVSANAYIWETDLYNASDNNDWSLPYVTVFYANLALESLDAGNNALRPASEKTNMRGQALFFRAFAYYQLLQQFAKAYNPQTANTDLGIVLRPTASIGDASQRATVAACYEQLRRDFEEAAALLNVSQIYKTRPNKGAAFAMLAKVYLLMNRFAEASAAVETALQLDGALMDYNEITDINTNPFERFNEEVLFHASLINITGVIYPNVAASLDLYRLYTANDLRKELFFNYKDEADIEFKGSYVGGGLNAQFGGISNNELYLLAAECAIRTGQFEKGMNWLNHLLGRRYVQGTFEPLMIRDPKEALETILIERRKELPFRNIRWADRKRLLFEPGWNVNIMRTVAGRNFTLNMEEDYLFEIPRKVIDLGGIEDNK